MNSESIVGYFAWMRSMKGPPRPEKFCVMRLGMNSDSAKFYQDRAIQIFPLNARQWELPLDVLADVFPCTRR